jgi:chaperonin GroEL
MTKTVLFGKEARDKLLAGVKKITDAVRVTMGSSGKCVLIGNAVYQDGFVHQLPSLVTKDGYTVTKHFHLPDLLENRGAMMIKEAAQQTVNEAGDATTCTCVLADAIVSEGVKLIDAGANGQELKKGIDSAVEMVVHRLKEMSIPVADDNEKIFNIATVSANNDTSIGRMIADAYKKIGPHGVIDIEAANGLETEIKISDGVKIDRGWVSNIFVNNRSKETCEFNDCLILLYDKRITHYTQLQRALELHQQKGNPVLIICEDVDEQGLGFLAVNVHQGRIKTCAIKSPGHGDIKREWMEDLELLTGATYLSDVRGIGIKEMEFEHFGFAKKVIVSRNDTVIIGGNADKKRLEDFVTDLKITLTQCKTEDERYPIEKRIARLTGGVAVIQVGAATEPELTEKLDRFDDAVRATKAAISEGYVAGGGIAFMRLSQQLHGGLAIEVDALRKGDMTFAEAISIYQQSGNLVQGCTELSLSDFQKGQQLLVKTLNRPFIQMMENVGLDADKMFHNVSRETGSTGYNTKTGELVDLIGAGIIDSTKALRCALQNAASIAGMILTTEALIEANA